jgi:transcriptional regulator with XRE-family HTH domain
MRNAVESSPTVNMAQLAARLRRAREELELSQTAVAWAADLCPEHYNKIERGHTAGIRINTLYKLCRVLGVRADYLLGLDEGDGFPLPPPSR